MMERAAETAALIGHVERAATCYIDAAVIAAEGGRADLVAGLLDRTRALASSPALTAERRQLILGRIGEIPRLGQATRTR